VRARTVAGLGSLTTRRPARPMEMTSLAPLTEVGPVTGSPLSTRQRAPGTLLAPHPRRCPVVVQAGSSGQTELLTPSPRWARGSGPVRISLGSRRRRIGCFRSLQRCKREIRIVRDGRNLVWVEPIAIDLSLQGARASDGHERTTGFQANRIADAKHGCHSKTRIMGGADMVRI